MYRKKIKFEIAEYIEKKELYEACDFREVSYKEKGIHCYVTFEIDNHAPHHEELKSMAKSLKRKGPSFYPVFIFVFLSFVLLSTFVVLLVKSQHQEFEFDFWTNVLSFLFPAVFCLMITVIYTIAYFKINERYILEGPIVRETFLEKVEAIKK